MTTVSVKNIGQGLRTFVNVDKQGVTLKPGDSRTIEMDPHHIMQLERGKDKPNNGVEVTMSAAERKGYEDELKEMRAANRKARLSARGGVKVQEMRTLPVMERLAKVDTRFITDPQTVHHPEQTADPNRKDQDGPGEEEQTDTANLDKTEQTDDQSEQSDEVNAEKAKGKGKKVTRVPLKKKGD